VRSQQLSATIAERQDGVLGGIIVVDEAVKIEDN
jgi:hypothetical protein